MKFLGELLGTFVLVFVGCGAVGMSVFYQWFNVFGTMGLIWGLGVSIAIYLTRSYSNAFLNPAVTIGFISLLKLKPREILKAIVAQFIGAAIAAFMLFLFFKENILNWESRYLENTEQSALLSQKTAVMFGEFFNGYSFMEAFFYEFIGTFLLMLIILLATRVRNIPNAIQPLLIGLGLAILITWIAPITQAGFNPARDFGPRIMAYFLGWGNNAVAQNWGVSFLVYIIGPILGAVLASKIWTLRQSKRDVG